MPVTSGPANERLPTTGVVEPDQQQIQELTPLVAGRVERVNVRLGDFVQAGSILLTVSSPQIAELQCRPADLTIVLTT
jgi:multidrug efflux pump subunit AcrA (membrane-fusion protein)